jgi:hypothetical protein
MSTAKKWRNIKRKPEKQLCISSGNEIKYVKPEISEHTEPKVYNYSIYISTENEVSELNFL